MSFKKKFYVWACYTLISLILIHLLLTNVLSSSVNTIVPNVIESVYEFGSDEIKEEVDEAIQDLCEDMLNGGKINNICDPTHQQELGALCQSIENEEEVDPELLESCEALESGALQNLCDVKEDHEESCQLFLENELEPGEFLGQHFSLNAQEAPIIHSSPAQTVILLLVAAFLLYVLYFVSDSNLLFLNKVGKMLITLSLLILIPFILASAYINTTNFDTSPLLEYMVLQEDNGQNPAFSLLPIFVVKMYDVEVLWIALIVFFLGLSAKLATQYLE